MRTGKRRGWGKAAGILLAAAAACPVAAQNVQSDPAVMAMSDGSAPAAENTLSAEGPPLRVGSFAPEPVLQGQGTPGIISFEADAPAAPRKADAAEQQLPLPRTMSEPGMPAGPPGIAGHGGPPGIAGHGGPPGYASEMPAEPTAVEQTPAQPMSWWQRFCYCMQDCFLGFREEFREPTLGYLLYAHNKTQVANGDAARMVLYHYDFEDGCTDLKPRGRDRLAKISTMLPKNFFPIVIERTTCAPDLDEGRRQAVLACLAHGPFPIPAERVVIGPSIAVGRSGVEARIVYSNLLRQTSTGPNTGSLISGGVGTFGGSVGGAGGGQGVSAGGGASPGIGP